MKSQPVLPRQAINAPSVALAVVALRLRGGASPRPPLSQSPSFAVITLL